MSFFARLLGTAPDPVEAVRPLWHRVVAISRQPDHYARCGVADTIDGRFDMIVHILSLTMLRMEASSDPGSDLGLQTARLTELFVEDMDGQLRENGIGDVVVGKHIGRLMGALGGRMAALRKVMARRDAAALAEVLERNIHWNDSPDPPALAVRLLDLSAELAARSDAEVLAGNFGEPQ
ncbi:ubiquinol-cytochrome C chaperone family protein [Altererythrobacter lauratis]|uniref:Ubiquinol-cytochrome C chaperone family protein n=1 Tax=Alteraurantiacibacter lauratis TaxID=2054627 RepID=A0ABV7EKG6_9SPHN